MRGGREGRGRWTGEGLAMARWRVVSGLWEVFDLEE